jgi:hypothetical protein
MLLPGTQTRFLIHLTNYGTTDTFSISAESSPVTKIEPHLTTISLASQSSTIVGIAATVPTNVSTLSSFTLRVSATGKSSAAANTAVLNLELDDDPGQPLLVRVKPGSCTAPVNLRSRGLTPVAIIATDSFDPARLNMNSIQFAGTLPPTRISRQDVGAPNAICNDTSPDGRVDLILLFDTQQLVAAVSSLLQLGPLDRQMTVSVPLTARTLDDTNALGFASIRMQN